MTEGPWGTHLGGFGGIHRAHIEPLHSQCVKKKVVHTFLYVDRNEVNLLR